MELRKCLGKNRVRRAKFGKIWPDRAIPKLSKHEHEIVEDRAACCVQTTFENHKFRRQRRRAHRPFGRDHRSGVAQAKARARVGKAARARPRVTASQFSRQWSNLNFWFKMCAPSSATCANWQVTKKRAQSRKRASAVNVSPSVPRNL